MRKNSKYSNTKSAISSIISSTSAQHFQFTPTYLVASLNKSQDQWLMITHEVSVFRNSVTWYDRLEGNGFTFLCPILLLKTTILHCYCCRSESCNVKIINTSKTSKEIHSGHSGLGKQHGFQVLSLWKHARVQQGFTCYGILQMIPVSPFLFWGIVEDA